MRGGGRWEVVRGGEGWWEVVRGCGGWGGGEGGEESLLGWCVGRQNGCILGWFVGETLGCTDGELEG